MQVTNITPDPKQHLKSVSTPHLDVIQLTKNMDHSLRNDPEHYVVPFPINLTEHIGRRSGPATRRSLAQTPGSALWHLTL